MVNKQEQHTTFSCITSGFFIFNNIVRGLAYQLISANHKFYFAQNVMFTMFMCVQVYPRPCPCSWLVGNLRLSEECRICPNKGDTLSLDSALGYELYFLSHGHGRVLGCDSILAKRTDYMMKVEGNTRGRKQRVPRGRGRGKRTNFQSTDLVVTVSNEDSSSSRLKPPVTTSQPRKIVLNRKTGKLNELCVSFVKLSWKYLIPWWCFPI